MTFSLKTAKFSTKVAFRYTFSLFLSHSRGKTKVAKLMTHYVRLVSHSISERYFLAKIRLFKDFTNFATRIQKWLQIRARPLLQKFYQIRKVKNTFTVFLGGEIPIFIFYSSTLNKDILAISHSLIYSRKYYDNSK